MRQELSQFLDYLEFERNRRPATINNHKSEINRFLDYLEEKNVELELVRPLYSFLTEKEMERFLPLPILALRDYALLELLYATGAYVGEIIKINTDDIDFNDRRILIRGERWRKRYVLFGRKAEIALKSYLNVRSLLIKKRSKEKGLFLDGRGKRIDFSLFARIIEKYWLLSGLERKITPRSFRNSFAAHFLSRGADPYFVQTLMGHREIKSTEKYGCISVGRLKKVLEKYHPTYYQRAERNYPPRENIANSFRSSSLIRY